MNLKYVLPSILGISLGLAAIAQPAAPKADPADKTQPTPQPGQPGEPGQPGGPGGPGARGPRQGGTPTTLDGAMKQMNGRFRQLKKQVTDATKKTDNLRLVNEMQQAAVLAKGMDPTEAFKKEPDSAKKTKMVVEFRRHMITLVENLITLEKQFLDDKLDDANMSVQALAKFKIENHEFFGVKED